MSELPEKRICLVVEYDGSAYSGWQIQPNAPSIQQALQKAVFYLTGEEVKVYGAGRTDSGVHARGQVATFLTRATIPEDKIAIALNTRLPKDIGVRKSFLVADNFDPRHDAKMKLYRYTIHSSSLRPVIGRQYCWHVKLPLNLERMKQAATHLLGEHDFTSLSNQERNAEGIDNTRSIERCEVVQEREKITVDVQGRSFTYNMVRNITGTLVDVGAGSIEPDAIPDILAARDRSKAGQGAPACGLCLEWIRYDGIEL